MSIDEFDEFGEVFSCVTIACPALCVVGTQQPIDCFITIFHYFKTVNQSCFRRCSENVLAPRAVM